MYCSDHHVGKKRVNKFFSSNNKRSNRDQNNLKPDNRNSIEKLKDLQKELFSEGYTMDDYQEEVQEKIDGNMLHYRGLSEKNVNELYGLFAQRLKREEERFNLIDDKHDLKKRQSKLFNEKKERIVREKKRELINQLLKEINKCNSVGVSRNSTGLSTDPDMWGDTKLLLFLGGRYLEGSDKEWCKIYHQLNSNDMYLFGFTNKKEFHDYIRNC